MTTVDTLARLAMDGARNVGMMLTDPKEDWEPVVMAVSRDGVLHVQLLRELLKYSPYPEAREDAAPAQQAIEEVARDTAAFAVETWVRERRGLAAAFVASAWQAPLPESGKMGVGARARHSPERQECVVITVADARERLAMWWAPIDRTPGQPPRLGEFETWDAPVKGRYVEALLRALTRTEGVD